MTTTATKPRANTGGRPRGSRPVNRRAIVTAFNRTVEGNAEEIFRRGIEQALQGDKDALRGLLEVIAAAISMADQPTTAAAR